MRAAVFVEPGRIELADRAIPDVGPNDALIRITTTTICGTDIYKATAGWRFGNLIDGAQAEYVLVPDAQGNLAPIPDGLSDDQVLMCPDIMSTGFKGAENANIRIGDVVAVFAQGPIGLCATAGARLQGASTIIVVDGNDHRLGIASQMGADVTLNFKTCDVVDEIMKLTGGRGVDASIEALGTQDTFESALRVLKPGGTLSSLGVYSSDLTIPLDALAAGLGDHRLNTALCPGGSEDNNLPAHNPAGQCAGG